MTNFKHSSLYIEYSTKINQPNPELLLGPHWKAVLNFWLFLDTLSLEQLKTIYERYDELEYYVRDAAYHAWNAGVVARDAAARAACCAAWDAAWYASVAAAGYATYEIIGSHKILSQNKPLIFLPLFLDVTP